MYNAEIILLSFSLLQGEPRRATASTIYFSFLAFIYIWLASVTALTIVPHVSTNYNVIIATALFFYMSFASISALLLGRLAIRCTYYVWLFAKRGKHVSPKSIDWPPSTKTSSDSDLAGNAPVRRSNSAVVTKAALQKSETFPKLMAFNRPFRRVFRSSLLISLSLSILHAHCWSRSLSSFKASSEMGATIFCRGIFGLLMAIFPSFTNHNKACSASQSCANENLIWVLWVGPILSHLFYFAMNEFGGKHHKSYRTSKINHRASEDIGISTSSSSLEREGFSDVYHDVHDDAANEEDVDNEWSISCTLEKFTKIRMERPKGTSTMVPWFHVMLVKSAFDLLVSFHVFLGRFDERKMQAALRRSKKSTDEGDHADPEGVFDFTQEGNSDGFWFDFMSDCGDGFNSSYQVSRCLAQPFLDVTTQNSTSKRRETRILPRGKILVIGGDLAYPDPSPGKLDKPSLLHLITILTLLFFSSTLESYETRLFRTFEDALSPPDEYRKEHVSIHKPALPVKSWALPTLGRKKVEEEEKKCSESHSPDDTLDRSLNSYSGPLAFSIPGNHDWFDGLATYNRYILSRDWLGGWLMPQTTSYFALQLPRGWWILGMDLALNNDINIEQFAFFADLADKSIKAEDNIIIVTHIPFWTLTNYEIHEIEPETNLTELMQSHLRGKVRLRLAGDLHHYTRHMPCSQSATTDRKESNASSSSNDDPVLIVSGGGGAFLHPTHTFKEEIKVGNEKIDYVRVAAYPSVNVSKHLSWMNLWQFRW